ncbi:acyl-CoA N-acyltransferase [Lipomyces arxii]|uniref:acyl-CoA N-acyltransferase n=1 Tax=Lipomyces arxii TaxID=56418 RepID=UPI0034CE6381
MGDTGFSTNNTVARHLAVSGSRNIGTVVFGEDFEFEAIYGCPAYFSDTDRTLYAKSPLDKLYVCNRCFKYATAASDMSVHSSSCSRQFSTPGKLVYQYNEFSIREVDGEQYKVYCQCLSLFAKLFVDTKSLYFAVDRFKFYVLIHHISPKQEQSVGYFSKEKLSWDENNLACILTFPPFQGQGLGQFLIEFSYHMSILEGKLGSPEKPLSEDGRKSYILYWCTAVAKALPRVEHYGKVSINDIADETGIRQDDILDALRSMNALQEMEVDDSKAESKYIVSKGNVLAWAAKKKINLNAPGLIDINYITI